MEVESPHQPCSTNSMREVQLTDPSTSTPIEPDQQHSAMLSTVELNVSGLSISIPPKLSLIASLTKTIRNWCHRPTTSSQNQRNHHFLCGSLQISTVSLADQCVATHDGLSIFRNVSLNVKPGQVCLILGGRDSGKTTLLKTLAGQLKLSDFTLSGSISFSGQNPPTSFWKTSKVGHLEREDYLNPLLTPRETLECIANLHNGAISVSSEMKWRIERLLTDFGLQGCADQRIGHPDAVGGLRPSVRRRVSIAIQLLTNPSILFCHEPTYGLDARSSYQLMEKLKDIARSQRIPIIATMRQTQSDIYPLIVESNGQLVVLSSGDVIYSGPARRALQWFESIDGIDPCPGGMNPFEYLVDLSGIDFSDEDKEVSTKARRRLLIDMWAMHSGKMAQGGEKMSEQQQQRQQQAPEEIDGAMSDIFCSSAPSPSFAGPLNSNRRISISSIRKKAMNPSLLAQSFWRAIARTLCHTVTLTQRALLCQRRNLGWIFWFVFLNAVLGVWIGYVFSSLSGKAVDIQSRFALIFILATFQPFVYLLLAIHRGSRDIRVFDRERAQRYYGSWSYIVSFILQNLPVALISVVCYGTIIYFLAHLRTEATIYYFYNILTLCGLQVFIITLALFFCSIFRGFMPTALICLTFYNDYYVSAGYYITADRLPRYYEKMSIVSPFALVFRILSSLEFSDRSFTCPFETNGGPSDAFRCSQYEGNNILDHEGRTLPHYFPAPIVYLLIHCAIFIFLAWIVLTLHVVEPNAQANPGNFVDIVLEVTHGIFAGFDPGAKRPPHLVHQASVRSFETADQLHYTMASGSAKKITPPSQRLYLDNVNGTSNFASIDVPVVKEAMITMSSTTSEIAMSVMDRSFPAMPTMDSLTIERAPPPPPAPWLSTSASSSSRAAATAIGNSGALSDRPLDYNNLGDNGAGVCHIDIWGQHRNRTIMTTDDNDIERDGAVLAPPRDLIEIRIERLGLYATVPRWVCNTATGSFWKPFVRRKERQRILHDLSVTFPPGQLTGIVGGRGTGKTALLEVILNRLSTSSSCTAMPMTATTLTVHGDVYFNASRNPCLAKLDAVCGYVSKDQSFLLKHLTVRETLQFAVELYLSSLCRDYSGQQQRSKQSRKDEQRVRVEALLDLVGLADCADSLVGDASMPGCSNSQRRRLAIALQLISEPTCLMLDEPITGLDAMEALEIIKILKMIARTGRTVICALHKPWSAVWNELDNVVLLMHGGRLGYAGKTSGVLHFFAAAHLVLPAHTNPADFVIEKTLIDYQSPQDEVETRRRIEQLAQFFAEYRIHMPSPYYNEDESNYNSNGNIEESQSPNGQSSRRTDAQFPRAKTTKKLRRRTPRYASFVRATPILARRSLLNAWRQKGIFLNRILAPCMASLMLNLYFTHVDRSPAGMLERFSFLQLQFFLSLYGAFVAENRFSVEIGLACHEISNGAYGASSFLLAYTANELPVTMVASALIVLLTYVVVPFQWALTSVSLLFGTTTILVMTGETLRMLFSTWISDSVGMSCSITLVVITMMNQMAGLFKPRLPLWLIKVNFLNLWRYTTEGLANGIYPGLRVECTPEEELELRCLIRNGESWMAFLRLNRFSISECLVGMIALSVFYRILVWVSLLIKTSRQRG